MALRNVTILRTVDVDGKTYFAGAAILTDETIALFDPTDIVVGSEYVPPDGSIAFTQYLLGKFGPFYGDPESYLNGEGAFTVPAGGGGGGASKAPMSAVLSTTSTVVAGSTFYTAPGQVAVNSQEVTRQLIMPPCTLKTLLVNFVQPNNIAGDGTIVVVVRRNASNTALLVTLPVAGTAQILTFEAEEVFDEGDLLSIAIINNNTNQNYTLTNSSIMIVAEL